MAIIEEVADTPPAPTELGRPAKLQQILKRVELARRKVKQEKPCEGIQPDEVRTIASAFTTADHTLGFLVLSTAVSFLRELYEKDNKISVEAATENIARLFYAEMDGGMRATAVAEVRQAIVLNSCLLQVDAAVGGFIFLRDGMIEWLQDVPELFPSNHLAWRNTSILLSLASGVPSCRPIIATHFQTWLRQQARASGDMLTRSSAAVALTKLSRALDDEAASPEGGLWSASQGKNSDEQARQKVAQDTELTSLMKGLVISGSEEEDASAAMDAVEGLAYLSSSERTLKESLSSDEVFLRHLFSLVPTLRKHNNLIARQIDDSPSAKVSTALTYGIATIIDNLVTYPPRLTGEAAQIDKLRRMARTGAVGPSGTLAEPAALEEVQEKDEVVAERGKRLIKAGVLPVLAALVKVVESIPTRRAVARAYLSLVEPKENRGVILQNGGAKALSFLSRAGFLPVNGTEPEPLLTNNRTKDFQKRTKEDLIPIQALAKLAITTEPRLVFGTSDTDIIDAIQPFHFIVLYPDSSLLQIFEGLMALTNLASVSPVVAERVATAELASKLEVLMLDDNTMVRRAAVELMCNIITTDAVLPRYGGALNSPGTPTSSSSTAPPPPAIISRLHVLLGLSDVSDIRTQLAASGALATLLSVSPNAVHALLLVPKGPVGVFAILGDIVDPSRLEDAYPSKEGEAVEKPSSGELLQLAHRGVVCVWSILSNVASLPPPPPPPVAASTAEQDADKTTEIAKRTSADKAGPTTMEAAILGAAEEEKLAAALVTLIKPLMAGEARNTPGPRQIIITAAQCLQWLNQRGIEVKT